MEHFFAKQHCPYFQDGRGALSEHIRFQGSADRDSAGALIQRGWRRYANDLYRMRCETCRLCISLRIDAAELSISNSMRRLLRLNRDLIIIPHEPRLSEDHLRLWREYSLWKHLSPAEDLDAEYFLGLSSPWSIILEYRTGDREGELLAISHIDPLQDGFSSVYFSISPSAKSRSLGSFSTLAEARIAQEYTRSNCASVKPVRGESIVDFYSHPRDPRGSDPSAVYYLGFWVPGAEKMDYKARFQPFSLLLDDENRSLPPHWLTFDTRTKALNHLRAVHWPGL